MSITNLYVAEDEVMSEINSILEEHDFERIKEELKDYLGLCKYDEHLLTRILDGQFAISSIYEALLDILEDIEEDSL